MRDLLERLLRTHHYQEDGCIRNGSFWQRGITLFYKVTTEKNGYFYGEFELSIHKKDNLYLNNRRDNKDFCIFCSKD